MHRTYFFIILFSFASSAFAQQKDSLISGSFKELPAKVFFEKLEAISPYYFYYNEAELDSIIINLTVTDQSIQNVLELAFKNTDVRYSIDKQNHIFITRNISLITTLPAHFFDKENAVKKETDSVNLLTIHALNPANKRTVENKIYEVGVKQNPLKQGSVILSGYVRNARSGEPVVNASISFEKINKGVLTDQYGYYSVTVPTGNYIVNVQSIGMRDTKYNVAIYNEGKLDLDVNEQVTTLKEVIISSQKTSNIRRMQLGVERLTIATIKTVPTVFGEADVLRVVTSLPGVKTVGEASTGFNVRGGSADQNLILLNDATIYNPSHFFGMFSSFNPEVVKDIELYKSSIPAKYGGRLSSVLDISVREGNKKEITGSAGIGLITSRFNIEGPIKKDKTSFLFGARTTYANWLLQFLPHPYDKAKASFNDGNLNIHHHMNEKNDFYLTAYLSNDHFNLANDTNYNYSNRNLVAKWRHHFSSKLNGSFSAGSDYYHYKNFNESNKISAYNLSFDINQLNLKTDFSYVLNAKNALTFGASSIRYQLHPGSLQPQGKESLIKTNIVPAEQGYESAVYLSDQYNINNNLSINAGLRYSLFNNLGPHDVTLYASGLPKDESTVKETRSYNKGQITKTYANPEYRLSVRYAISDNFSVKGAYNTLVQYIHVLSNTAAMAPTDIWKLSDANIKPQRGEQYSVGLYKNLKSNTIETSMEVYYKRIHDFLDYKSGATLVLNHHIETDVINTKAKAYGLELMIKRTAGKLTGWVSYTYSRILLKMDDPTIGTPVNRGEFYPANYDKPHDVTLVSNFKVNHRFSASMNVTYSTGRPITLPIGRFYYAGSQRVLYSDRNAYRIPDYFRTDVAMNIDGNHKVKQKTHNSWTIGIYNITGKRNPYSVYYVTENGVINGYKLSIFGSIIPFINFNIRF